MCGKTAFFLIIPIVLDSRHWTAHIQTMDQGVIRNLKTIYSRNLLLELVQEAYDDLRPFWKNLSVLDAIYYVDAAWKLVKISTVKKSSRAILSDKENEVPTNVDDSAHLQRNILY
ncbi:hypothetical protein AVEN_100822-1 [Araneus ventricosus]|uniref:DDE-1 domain-containing protein n=1 Tax=Araneus ventricosus TaxID=182803 RepID=A0A4Y2AWL3_ARAVE|nr:hypothetical protein AVEN_100822-1 [Araneus ventricosus]